MNVYLLYEDKERNKSGGYFDSASVVSDLGLDILFSAASHDQEEQEGGRRQLTGQDPFLGDVLRRVMITPLATEAEIRYRQEILQDVIRCPALIRELYEFAKETILQWEKLGRNLDEKNKKSHSDASLMARVNLLELFVGQMDVLTKLAAGFQKLLPDEITPPQSEPLLQSQGIRAFFSRLKTSYSPKLRETLQKILADISFYSEADHTVTGKDRNVHMVLTGGLMDGFKLNDLKLEDLETNNKKRKRLRRKKDMMELLLATFDPTFNQLSYEETVVSQMLHVEYRVVDYLVTCCEGFVDDCRSFFDELRFQTAFYLGAYHLYQNMRRLKLPVCWPAAASQDALQFENLKELSMALCHRGIPVGNDVKLDHTMCCIITGANQGGKSTYLRSIGIAQTLMQSGLFVCADHYASGIFPHLYMHFTRREDSEMNSGRLDEELQRMSRMIDQIRNHGTRRRDTMMLLNESFATTTEKEGSVIAYDVIKALLANNVKILTVTHLLSFAQKMYQEQADGVEFFSAERKEDGRRTYRIIHSAPQLTSFGLDLYQEIVEG